MAPHIFGQRRTEGISPSSQSPGAQAERIMKTAGSIRTVVRSQVGSAKCGQQARPAPSIRSAGDLGRIIVSLDYLQNQLAVAQFPFADVSIMSSPSAERDIDERNGVVRRDFQPCIVICRLLECLIKPAACEKRLSANDHGGCCDEIADKEPFVESSLQKRLPNGGSSLASGNDRTRGCDQPPVGHALSRAHAQVCRREAPRINRPSSPTSSTRASRRSS